MANRGQAIEILDENNNILYPRTNANNVYFGDTGKMVGTALGDAITDLGNLQTKTNNIDTEVTEARNSQTTNYPNLKTRLDDMDSRIGQGGGGGNLQEVVDAREDVTNTIHKDLKTRLDSDYNKLNTNKVDKTQATTTPTPNTIVERTVNANINIGNDVFFNDVVGAGGYLGGIGIGSGDTNGTPFVNQPVHTKTNNDKVQIWTSETAPIDEDATNNTVVKRDNNGFVRGKAFCIYDNNGVNTHNLFSDYLGTDEPWIFYDRRKTQGQIHTSLNLPVEEGQFTPTIGGTTTNGNLNYVTQIGQYRAIGNNVWVNIAIQTNGGTLPTGEIRIKGLPFANRGSLASWTIGFVRGISGGAGKYLGIVCDASPTIDYARLIHSDMGSTTVAIGAINNTQIAPNGNIHIVASCKMTRVL